MDFKEAADRVRNEARRVEAFLLISEVLDRLGNLEQTERDLLARIKVAQDAADAAAAERDTASAAITDVRVQAQAILDAAQRGARDIHAKAQAEAAEIVANGGAAVDQARKKALADSAQTLKEAASILATAQAERAEIEAETVVLRGQVAAGKSELARIEAALTEAKATAKRLLA